MVKLRDFPKGEGLFIGNFSFLNSVKNAKTIVQTNNQNQPIQPNQNPYPVQNQPNTGKTSGVKNNKKQKP
jgi:hypothetical protein